MEQVDPPAEIISLLQPEWARQYEAFPIGANPTEIEIVLAIHSMRTVWKT